MEEIKSTNNAQRLIKWMVGKKRMLIFVTGPTGSGKSTIVDSMAKMGGAVAIHPGKAIRKDPRMMEILLKQNNPSAPRATEEFVRKYVIDRLKTSGERSVVVDGMPRNLVQVNWCVDTSIDYKMTLVFVSVVVPYKCRVERLMKRKQQGDEKLLHKRLKSDEAVIPAVVSRARNVVVGGKFGIFFEIYNRRGDDNLAHGGIDGLEKY